VSTKRQARRAACKPLALAAWIGLLGIVLVAIAGPLFITSSPSRVALEDRFIAPLWLDRDWDHLLGTDALGRDILARLIAGARVSLVIGLSVVAISAIVGMLIGVVAGYLGGLADAVAMRVVDAQLAFPGLVLILAVVGALGASVGVIIAVLSAYGWMIFARLSRGITVQLKTGGHVLAAELIGCSRRRVIFRHLLPALGGPLFTQGMLELGRVMLAEASLSYLGLGIQPPEASWGLMVAENRPYLVSAWWTVTLPGLTLAACVLMINLLASWGRLQLDPLQRQVVRSRGRRKAASAHNDATEGARPMRSRRSRALLEVSGLKVALYGSESSRIEVVRDVDFRVDSSHTLGIIGESGCAKTTSMMALVGLLPEYAEVTARSVRWHGEEISLTDLQAMRGSRIGFVFQDPMTALNPLMVVGEQIAECLRKEGAGRAAARRGVEKLLTEVGIANPGRCARNYPWELSGGMAQRVLIAMALASEPELLIADEPTTAIDVRLRKRVLALIGTLQRKRGLAMLLVSHDLAVVKSQADEIAVMYAGRVVEFGDASSIATRARHPYTRAMHACTLNPFEESRLSPIGGDPPQPTLIGDDCAFRPRCGFSTPACVVDPQLDFHGREDLATLVACWNPIETDK
jgi:peptide/nickel transport system permease protein